MAVRVEHARFAAPVPPVPLRRRLYGFGSVFGKSLRDARIGWLIVTATLGLGLLAAGAGMSSEYGTLAARRELDMLSTSLPPVMAGIYGNPVNVDTLGGFVTWHYGGYFTLLAALWSILALSGTLAGEARRGSLDIVAVAPIPRARIAVEKVAGHVTAMAAAMAVVALAAWTSGVVFATFPGDEVAPAAAAGFAVGLGLRALMAGALAFALAAFLSRGAAAGLAGAILLGGYFLTAYRAVVPAFDVASQASWLRWTSDHLPLAGRWDWTPVVVVAVGCVVLLGVGVVGFVRRDVGIASASRLPATPRLLLGVGGPARRAFGEVLPASVAWGAGLGAFGFLMAAASRTFADEMHKIPNLLQAFSVWLPGIDLTSPVGFLELLFVDFGLVLVGLAAAALVAGRMGDETSGRLEMLLTVPVSRVRWAIANGIGTWLGIGVVTAILAASLAIGVALAGGEVATPLAGTLVLALYAAALAGVGFAVGGVVRPSLAGPVVAGLAIATSLLDLLGPAFGWPRWLQDLALTNHMGQPMLGTWDIGGIVACVVLAVGGVLLGAWGLRRRDVSD